MKSSFIRPVRWIQSRVGRLSMLQIMVLGFGTMTLIGAVLLKLPISLEAGKSLTWTEAFFTATSAVCVTGLIVVDTPVHFSTFGEAVILGLFQLGGFGIVAVSAGLFLSIRGTVSLTHRLSLRNFFLDWEFRRLRRGVQRAFILFLLLEALGTAILSWQFWSDHPPLRAIWHGLFHAVSALCNAGFSLNVDSLVGYARNPIVVFTVSALIVIGGLGFIVVAELTERNSGEDRRMSLHTRTMLIATAVALGAGVLGFGLLEDSHWLEVLFQSVTTRTAGFNTVELTTWSTSSVLLIYFLMFVGAGPASMAGGIKLTTLTVLLADFWRRVRGGEYAHWFRRRFSPRLVNEAFILLMLGLLTVGLAVFLLTLTEPFSLEKILFEVISGFGTVGLSLGITPKLSVFGQWVIIGCMFIGRLGPLAFVFLLIKQHERKYTYPEEDVLIG